MPETGKRVSWVELYLDLVFVLAVGQLAHLIVAEPRMHSVWIALGLFFALWWTWVGFAVLYNRHGADEPNQRFLFLLASIPAGVAAVAIDPASHGDVAVFAGSLAVIRLLLAFGYVVAEGGTDILRERITRACLTSATLFAVSIAVPEPFRYVLWLVAIGLESSTMLTEDRAAMERARREHDFKAMKPTNPDEVLDAHHFAERFGLFLIILLGEVLVEAGQSAVTGENAADVGRWAALVAAMSLAAGLWWLYFDSAVEINLKVLELTGGSTTMARAIFAIGHMVPSFALLVVAAGVGLLLEEDPPPFAAWATCVGIGIYLLGTRAFLRARGRVNGATRALMVAATFNLARLWPHLSPHEYLWLLTAWTVVCAALTTRRGPRTEEDDLVTLAAGRPRPDRAERERGPRRGRRRSAAAEPAD